jgi:hypothetical protein
MKTHHDGHDRPWSAVQETESEKVIPFEFGYWVDRNFP